MNPDKQHIDADRPNVEESSFGREDSEVSGIAQQMRSAGSDDSIQQEDSHFNQHLMMEYENGMVDEYGGLNDQFPTNARNAGDKQHRTGNGAFQKEDQKLEKYSKVSEFLLQAENIFLSGIRNTLTYQQNRNFLYNERRCLEILHSNNSVFTFEAYKCTMVMCCILLDSALALIKEERYYLAEKYLLRAKQITEPSEKHLKAAEKNKRRSGQEGEDENNEDDSIQNKEEEDGEESEEGIFEKDFKYHEVRIEIALNLCEVYKSQRKQLKKHLRTLAKTQQGRGGFPGQNANAAGNPMNSIKEEQEGAEIEHDAGGGATIGAASETKEKPGQFARVQLDGDDEDDEEEDRIGFIKEKKQKKEKDLQKEEQIAKEEQKDEAENQETDKMEKALLILNDIQETITEEYFKAAKYDLKGTLCKFFQKKVEVLNEMLKEVETGRQGEDTKRQEDEEEMSIEMLRCAEFVISTLEAILLPQKPGESAETQADAVFLANILSYTWTKLGKYYRKRQETDKAEQCYRNAYEKLQNFFREGTDRLFLQDKFKRKYEKFIGKLAFDQIGENSVVEFAEFEDDIKFQKHQLAASHNLNKKNYLASSGISASPATPAAQFYVAPDYLNQLQSHHTFKSLNKHRHLKKVPIQPVHPAAVNYNNNYVNSNANNNNPSSTSYQLLQQAPAQPAGSNSSQKFKKSLQIQLEFYRQQVQGNNMQPKIDKIEEVADSNPANNMSSPTVPFIFSRQPSSIIKHPQSAKARNPSTSQQKRFEEAYQTPQSSTNLGIDGGHARPSSSSSNQPSFTKKLVRPSSSNSASTNFKRSLHKKVPSLQSKLTCMTAVDIQNPYSHRNPISDAPENSQSPSDRFQQNIAQNHNNNSNNVRFLSEESSLHPIQSFASLKASKVLKVTPSQKALIQQGQAEKAGLSANRRLSVQKGTKEGAIMDNIVNFVDTISKQQQQSSQMNNGLVSSGSRSTLASSNRFLIPASKRPSSSNLFFATNRLLQPYSIQTPSQQRENAINDKRPGQPQSQQQLSQTQLQQLPVNKQNITNSDISAGAATLLKLNSKYSNVPSSAERIFATMSSMRNQLNGLFDKPGSSQTELQPGSLGDAGKYQIRLSQEEKEQMSILINQRPQAQSSVSFKKKGGVQYLETKNGIKNNNQSIQGKKSQASQQYITTVSQNKQANTSDIKKESSQRRVASIEKVGTKGKDQSFSSQHQFPPSIIQSPTRENYPIASSPLPPQLLGSNGNGGVGMNSKSVISQQNPSPMAKERENELQITKSPTQNASFTKKSDTDHLQQPPQNQAQQANHDNSKMLKSVKLFDSSKTSIPPSSKVDDKNHPKQQQQQQQQQVLRKQVSTNLTDGVFKSSTATYDQFQLDIPPIQNSSTEEKRRSGHFSAPFIKQKFDQFQNMNDEISKKNSNKINETQSSQEDDDLSPEASKDKKIAYSYDGEDILQEQDEQQVQQQQQQQQPQQLSKSGLIMPADDNLPVGDDMKRSDKRLGNSNLMVKSTASNKNSSVLPDAKLITSMLQPNQQSQDMNKSMQSYHDNNNNNTLQTSQQFVGVNLTNQNNNTEKSILPTVSLAPPMDKSTRLRLSSVPGPSMLSSSKPVAQPAGVVKVVKFPSVQQSKYLFVQNRIQELLFVPMLFYKSFQSFSLCQWYVSNIQITLESVSEDENAEDIEQILKKTYQQASQNKGGLPATSDKIRYDIRMAIFLQSSITDSFNVSNPLIFSLKNQPLNFIDHLWPNDKQKMETKYELATLLLDRWIRERDFNVVEEFYNIELSYQNVKVQFILRGDVSPEFNKLLAKESDSSDNSEQALKASEKSDQIQLFGMKLNFIINKIARVVKCSQGDVIKLPIDSNSVDNALLSLQANNLQTLRLHHNNRRHLKNIISYYQMNNLNMEYISQIAQFKSGNNPMNILHKQSGSLVLSNQQSERLKQQQQLQMGETESIPIDQFSRRRDGESPRHNTEAFESQQRQKLPYFSGATSFSSSSPHLISQIPLRTLGTAGVPSTFSTVQYLIPQRNPQKYQNLKLKMKERVLQVKRDSDNVVPLEMQVSASIPSDSSPLLPGNSSAHNTNTNNPDKETSPSFYNLVVTSPRRIQPLSLQTQQTANETFSPSQRKRNSISNQMSFGFTSAVEFQQQQQSKIQLLNSQSLSQQVASVSPINSPVISWMDSREDATLTKQQEQAKLAEEYKRKYDLAAASAAQSPNSLQSPPLAPILLAAHGRQSNLRIDSLKRQVRDNQTTLPDNNILLAESPQSLGQPSPRNSFSVANSSFSSPVNGQPITFDPLQRMPSLLSNKSSKSLFSRFAMQHRDDSNQSQEEGQDSKKNVNQSNLPMEFASPNAENNNNNIINVGSPIQKISSAFNEYFPPLQPEKQQTLISPRFALSFSKIPLKDTDEDKVESEDYQEDIIQNNKECGDQFLGLSQQYNYETFYMNPFANPQLLLKTAIKRDQLFFFVQIFFVYDEKVQQNIFYEQALLHSTFILKADSMIYKSGWKCEISLGFDQFVEKLIKPRTSFCFFKFLYNRGFSPKQKLAIKEGLEQELLVRDCQFVFAWDNPSPTASGNQGLDNSESQNEEAESELPEVEQQLNNQEELSAYEPNNIETIAMDLEINRKPQKKQLINLQKASFSRSKSDDLEAQKCTHHQIQPNQVISNIGFDTQELARIIEAAPLIVQSDKLFIQSEKERVPKWADRKIYGSRLPITSGEEQVVEYRSNLDIKLLAQQGLTKLQNYETPARQEDFTSTFFLLYRSDMIVMLKYIQTETTSYHKLTVYRPLSKQPLTIITIKEQAILERCLNLKWLDATIITLMKQYNTVASPSKQRMSQPHINQGLPSIENLKCSLISNILTCKSQTNGSRVQISSLFSAESERIRHISFSNRIERQRSQNALLLAGLTACEGTAQRKRKSQLREFLQIAKYAIATFDVNNEWKFQQNEVILKNFDRKTLRTYSYIQNRQKVLLVITVFRAKTHLGFDKSVFIRVDIVPWKGQRNKLFKLLFDRSDITHLFDREYSFSNAFNELLLFKIVEKISKSLVYSKSQMYKSFSIPLAKINPQQVDRHQFCLINRFSIKPPGMLIPKEIGKHSFMELIQRGERVLFTSVKRVLNTYAIVTIGYYSQLDYFYMQIYLPSNCRRFTNTFYSSNLQNLSGDFLNTVLQERIVNKNFQELSNAKDYHSFQSRYINLDPSKSQSAKAVSKGNSIKQQAGTFKTTKQMTNLTEESMDSSGELLQSSQQFYLDKKPFFDILLSNNTPSNVQQHPSFFELAIWEEIVHLTGISIDSNGEMLMTINNYSGVMREYLLKGLVNFSGNKNGLFEVLIRFRDEKTKQDLLSSPQISLEDPEQVKLDMYVRINFFEKINSVNEKIMLRQIFFQYYSHNREKFRNIPKEAHQFHQYANLATQSQPSAHLYATPNHHHHPHQFNNNKSNEDLDFNSNFNNNFHNNLNSNNNNNNLASHVDGQQTPQSNQPHFLDFSECTFYQADLISISLLLLDRIRASIQQQYSQTINFYDHENEVFDTANKSRVAIEGVNQLILAPLQQQEIVSNIASTYLYEDAIVAKNLIASQPSLSNMDDGAQSQEQNKQIQLIDKKARKKIKMNNNVNINELLDSENRLLYMKTLYRGIFTVRPLQILAIFYYNKFYIQVYNTVNGKDMITNLSFSTVEHQIPYLRHMLQLELYQEIGKRIFLSFKNRIMIKSYPELIDF